MNVTSFVNADLSINGSVLCTIGPDRKINCVLDDIRCLLNSMQRDDYLNKLDDSSGSL